MQKILIISEDFVFITVMHRILNNHFPSAKIHHFQSFADIKNILFREKADFIILDDVITGAASHEVVSYLRLEKKIISPIYYFSNTEYHEEVKALERGANFFIKKPFNPDNTIDHFKSTLGIIRETVQHEN
jgi:DNA-binding NtrC family response regulator